MALRFAGALLAVAVMGLAAACSAGSDKDAPEDGDAFHDQGSEGASRVGPAPEAESGAQPTGPGTDSDGTAFDSTRKVIFTSELTLEAEDVTAQFLEIGRIATARGGFVADSQLVQRDDGGREQSYGSITIRVPAEARDDVLNQLRTLEGVTVASERSTAQEVTEEYTDLESRLRNLERSEQQYLVLLERASSIQDILTVSERIDGVRAEIEQIKGRLQVLDDLVDLATISIAIEPVTTAMASTGNGGGFTAAWSDAWEAMGDVAGGLSVAGAWALVIAICAAPVALAGGAVALAGRRRHPRATAP